MAVNEAECFPIFKINFISSFLFCPFIDWGQLLFFIAYEFFK